MFPGNQWVSWLMLANRISKLLILNIESGFNSLPVLQRHSYVNKPSHLTSVQLSLQGLKHEDNLLLKP
jgi:hypothetical protein